MVNEYFSLEGYCDFFHKNYRKCMGQKKSNFKSIDFIFIFSQNADNR